MALDIERARGETKGVTRVTHFDNAGSSLPPNSVVDAVVRHLELEAEVGGYEAAARREADLERVYDSCAALLGCERDEIAVVESATRAWNTLFGGMTLTEGDRILVSQAEYGGNALAMLHTARRTGARVEVVPNDETGQISLEALAATIDERVRLISLTHVPTHSGLVNPAAEVGAIAREANVFYFLDASQSVGQMPVDVGSIGCDALCTTGRKFLRAPRGTGLLYVSKRAKEHVPPPFVDLRSATWTSDTAIEVRNDARRFESWEGSRACKLGLGQAVDYALSIGLPAIEERVGALAHRLRRALSDTPRVRVHDQGRVKCGIVTFTVEDRRSDAVARRLAERKINVFVSLPETARFDFSSRSLPPLVRASLHYFNTEEEVDRLCMAIRELAKS